MPFSCFGSSLLLLGSLLILAIAAWSRALKPSGSLANFALWMLFRKGFLSIPAGKAIFSPLYGLNAEVRSPQRLLLQDEMLSSLIFLPCLWLRNVSRKRMDEVWAKTCEFT